MNFKYNRTRRSDCRVMIWGLAVFLISSISSGMKVITKTDSEHCRSLRYGIEELSDSTSMRYDLKTDKDVFRNAGTSTGDWIEQDTHPNRDLAGLRLRMLTISSPRTDRDERSWLQLRKEWDPNMKITSPQDAQNFVAKFDPKILERSIEKTLHMNFKDYLHNILLTIGRSRRQTRLSKRYETWKKLLQPKTSNLAIVNEILKLYPVWSRLDLEAASRDQLIEKSFAQVMKFPVKENHEETFEVNCNNEEEIKLFLKKLLAWQIEHDDTNSEQAVKVKKSPARLFSHNESFDLFDSVLRRGLDGPKFFRVDAGCIDKVVKQLYPFPGTFGVNEDREREIEIRVNKVFDTYLGKKSFLLREPVTKEHNIEPREEWIVRTDLACVHSVVMRMMNEPDGELARTVAYFHQRVSERYAQRSFPIEYLEEAYRTSAPPQFHACTQDRFDFRCLKNSSSTTKKHVDLRGNLYALTLGSLRMPGHFESLRKLPRYMRARGRRTANGYFNSKEEQKPTTFKSLENVDEQ